MWSPDGKLIAFSANRTDNPRCERQQRHLRHRAGKGATPRKLTTSIGSDSSPAFSPDGKSIAYLTGGDPKDIWYATNNVALVPVAGGEPKIVSAGLDRNVRSPQFSATARASRARAPTARASTPF